MNKKPITLLLTILALQCATAQKLEFKGYTGGMFVHSGHIKSNSFEVTTGLGETSTHQIKNLTFGLGGKLAFQFGNSLRLGMEGYNSTVTYGDYKSSFSVGWGGLLAEYLLDYKRVSYFFGATFGGGRVENLVVTEPQTLNFQTSKILRRQYGVGIISPYYGAEIKITEKLRFVYKADYMFPISNKQDDWGRGFRWYVGMTFRPQG
ncbi:MAG: hypothetical protein LBP96_04245 [Bacteroidales bacterium]|jgi:hypothetical protein|nr:hypothetical protein [Bacteroidales bacterium]